jgi:hypothetical protein
MKTRKQVLIQGILALISVIGMVFGRTINVPDNYSKIYGLPIQWGVHQLVTIAGPVDYWRINLLGMIIDLVFWLALILVSPILYERFTVVSCEICLE